MVFSVNDTTRWYQVLQDNDAKAQDFTRYYRVPGMNHCRGGSATDDFDLVDAVVNWVEKASPPFAPCALIPPKPFIWARVTLTPLRIFRASNTRVACFRVVTCRSFRGGVYSKPLG